jgi:predicted nucleic acid-binding protein
MTFRFGVRVLSVDLVHVLSAAALSQQQGLLSGDALVVAVMQAHGLTLVASHDADFDRVPGITRYAPA